MLGEFAGKVALITGAASGIGRGLAQEFGRLGMKILATDINAADIAGTAAALSEAGIAHATASLDIRDQSAWEAAVTLAEQRLGPVQLLCNAAGVTVAPGPVLDLAPEGWAWVIQTNLTGTYLGLRTVACRLRDAGLPGHIVNISSIQGLYGAAGFAAYNASKFAIMGLSETARVELAPHHIGVSVVCPGPTRGNIMANSHKIAPHLVAAGRKRARTDLPNFQSPETVAGKIADGVRHNRLFIMTHSEYRPIVEARFAALAAAFDAPVADHLRAQVCASEAASLAIYALPPAA